MVKLAQPWTNWLKYKMTKTIFLNILREINDTAQLYSVT